jgi:NitT/TauT family transport system substrate-binding protein
MMRRRAFLGGAAAIGARATWPRIAAAQALAPMTVAAIPSEISAQAFYALANGTFKKDGLDVTIAKFPNGGATSTAVVAGAADVGYANAISVALARSRNIPLTILAAANLHVHEAPTAGILVVKKTSPIQKASDLAGKVVAVIGINNIADLGTREWIDKNGGDVKAVKFVELPFAEMKAALEVGRIDAAALDATGDPLLGKPDDTLRVIGNAFDAISPRFVPSVWFSTVDFATKKTATARAFVAAMRETATWANAHHRESADILATVTRDTPQQIQSITRVTYGDRLTPDLIQPSLDAAYKYGLVKQPFAAADLITVL